MNQLNDILIANIKKYMSTNKLNLNLSIKIDVKLCMKNMTESKRAIERAKMS